MTQMMMMMMIVLTHPASHRMDHRRHLANHHSRQSLSTQSLCAIYANEMVVLAAISETCQYLQYTFALHNVYKFSLFLVAERLLVDLQVTNLWLCFADCDISPASLVTFLSLHGFN